MSIFTADQPHVSHTLSSLSRSQSRSLTLSPILIASLSVFLSLSLFLPPSLPASVYVSLFCPLGLVGSSRLFQKVRAAEAATLHPHLQVKPETVTGRNHNTDRHSASRKAGATVLRLHQNPSSLDSILWGTSEWKCLGG